MGTIVVAKRDILKGIKDCQDIRAARAQLLKLEVEMWSLMSSLAKYEKDKDFMATVDKGFTPEMKKATDEYGWLKVVVGRNIPGGQTILFYVQSEGPKQVPGARGVTQGPSAKAQTPPRPLTPESMESLLKGKEENVYPSRASKRKLMEAKPGDWVRIRVIHKTPGEKDRAYVYIHTVLSTDDQGIQIREERETPVEGAPGKREKVMDVSVRWDLMGVDSYPFLLVFGEKTSSGQEKLRVGNREFVCEWAERKGKGYKSETVYARRVWFCPDAALSGILRQVESVEEPGKEPWDRVVMEVLDQGSGAPAGGGK